MLQDATVFATIAVSDLQKSIDWYSSKLGLRASNLSEKDGEKMLQAGHGTMLSLHEPLRQVSEHTAAAFMVEDLLTTVQQLRSKGVKFEDYDLPGLKTDNGIATSPTGKCAWFKDPDGNILAINERQ